MTQPMFSDEIMSRSLWHLKLRTGPRVFLPSNMTLHLKDKFWFFFATGDQQNEGGKRSIFTEDELFHTPDMAQNANL